MNCDNFLAYKKLKMYALKLLSRKEYSVSNLRQKLSKYSHCKLDSTDESVIESILSELVKKKFLSDSRAVESLINQKLPQYGIMKLKSELGKLGVSRDLVEESLEKVVSSEYQRAYKLLNKKYKNMPLNIKEIISQKNFLMRKGFLAEISNKVVNDRLKSRDSVII